MRVLYVLSRFPNVSNTFIISEIAELIRQGVEVDVVSFDRPGKNDVTAHDEVERYRMLERTTYSSRARTVDNILLHPATFLSARGPYMLWERRPLHLWTSAASLAVMIRKGGYDAVHSHFASGTSKAALTGALAAGVPFTFTTHAYDLYDREKRIPPSELATMASRSRAAITISEYNKRYIEGLEGVPPGRVRVVRCGIDPEKYVPSGKGGRTMALTVSRLVEKKGLVHLLEAVGALKERHPDMDLRFVICGTGPLEGVLAERVRSLGLEGTVELPGFVSDREMEELYRKAVMFVLPCVEAESGDVDGIPFSFMESMARGVPVISTGVSGIPELVEDGVSGLLSPPGDPKALADNIYKAYSDPGLRGSMIRSGRERVLSEFNIKKSVSDLVDIWKGA